MFTLVLRLTLTFVLTRHSRSCLIIPIATNTGKPGEGDKMQTTIAPNGHKYISAVYRGTEYTLHRGSFGWELHSRRLSYGGRFHHGTFKGYFATLADVQAKCRAFAGAQLSAVL